MQEREDQDSRRQETKGDFGEITLFFPKVNVLQPPHEGPSEPIPTSAVIRRKLRRP